jgi:EPS-associated MarR family transcriptional regulator
MLERSTFPTRSASETNDQEASRLAVLRLLSEQPAISQRELSAALGLSLGKTHYVLHALLDRGLVKARNFQRSHRKLAYAYVLTPRGLTEKIQLTRRFLARKEAEYVELEKMIAALHVELEAHASNASPTGQPSGAGEPR